MMLMSLNDKSSPKFLTRNIVETPHFEVSHRPLYQNHLHGLEPSKFKL